MSLARYCYLIICGLLVFSCAQIGGISGGPKDTTAPKVKSLVPENKMVNFSSKTIVYHFDEFISLNNPNENCIILPAGPTIKASVHKKQLTLEIEGNLDENTTYQISLNGLVKDTREGNDSLMHYVFSTGNMLDSISFYGKVVDAYTNQLLENITVCLYKNGDSIQKKPRYFVKTNKKGEFNFEHVKPNTYQLYAFNDVNKDLTYQLNEKVAFSDSLINLENFTNDSTTVLRLFQNPLPKKIKDKQVVYPRMINLSTTYSVKETIFEFNSEVINTENITYHKEDSISILLPNALVENNVLIVKNENQIDSISFFAVSKNLSLAASPIFYPLNKDLSKSKIGEIIFSDFIKQIDTSLILIQTGDSIKVPYKLENQLNKINFVFPDTLRKNFKIQFFKDAITFDNGSKNNQHDFPITVRDKSNFGTMILKKELEDSTILEFILNNKVVHQVTKLDLKKNSTIEYLEPGEYTFRLIIDENYNNKWDVGSVFDKIQPEKIMLFSEKVKIRANWETEVEFEFN
jgi:hypothetical protein